MKLHKILIWTTPGSLIYLICVGVSGAGGDGMHWVGPWWRPGLAAFCAIATAGVWSVIKTDLEIDRVKEMRSEVMRVSADEREVIEAMRKDQS